MERIEKKSGDFLLLVTLILLLGMGISVLFSASNYFSQRKFGDPLYLFKRQLLWIALGCAVGFVAARTPVEMFKQASPYILLASLILSILPLVPGIGIPILGARRWIFFLGLSFEPSELVKFALILYLALIFAKKQEQMSDWVNSILPPLIIVLLFAVLIYLQNDFSNTLFILLIAGEMFFLANIPMLYFIPLGLAVLPVSGFLLLTQEHRVRRLIAFINPLMDPEGTAFQLIAARSAFVNGGFWGRGLGRGMKKLGGLPEAHSDFIFAVLGEEAGFVGAVFVLSLFVLFAWRGLRIALNSPDSFSYYLGAGITSTIFLQAMMNVMVATGLVPVTGVPLPFFSAGGSAMLVTLLMCGLLINLSRGEENPRRLSRV